MGFCFFFDILILTFTSTRACEMCFKDFKDALCVCGGGGLNGGVPVEQSSILPSCEGKLSEEGFGAEPKLCSFKKFAHLSSWQRATWPT